MIENFKNIINHSNRFYLVGVVLSAKSETYSLLQVLFAQGELKIEKRVRRNTLNELFDELKSDYPVILHLGGDKIVSKAAENKQGYRNTLVFKANLEAFYFYEYINDNTRFVSLTRKEVVEGLVKTFNDKSKFVVHLAFGPFVLANIIPVLKEQNTLFSGQYQLDINEGAIQGFKKTENSIESYTIDGEDISQEEIPAIATFLEYKFPNQKTEFENTFLDPNQSEHRFKVWSKTLGVSALVFVLLALFIGHNILNGNLKTLAEKESLYSLSQQTVTRVNNLKAELELKEKVLQTSGVVSKNYLTQYFAEIGNTVPNTVTLTSVDVIPLAKKIKKGKKLTFSLETIEVVGESKNDELFNNWIKTLGGLSWVSKIDIMDYTRLSSANSQFVLKIQL